MAKYRRDVRKGRSTAPKKQGSSGAATKIVALSIGVGLIVAIAAALYWPESGNSLSGQGPGMVSEAGAAPEEFQFALKPVDPNLSAEEKDRLLRQEQIDVAVRLAEGLPGDSDAIFLLAMAYQEQGNSVEAARCLERCLELQPGRADACDHLGRIAQQEGRHSDAVTWFRKAGQIEPRMAGLHFRLGQAYQSQGKTDEAVVEVNRNVELYPTAPDNYVTLGELFLQKQDYAAARDNYEKAVKLDPNLAKAYFGLASACARLGQKEEAAEYRLKFKEIEDTKRDLARDRRATFDPLQVTRDSVAHTHTDVARVLNVRGQAAGAEQLWRRAAELDPNNVTCRFGLADNLLRREELTEALPWYQQIAEVQPDNGVAWFFTGHIHEKLERVSDAERAYTKVTQVSPDRPEGFLALSQLLFVNGGDLERADQLAQRAAELAPTAPNFALVARIHLKNGNRAGALSAVGRAVQLDPQNPEYRQLQQQIQEN